MQLNQFSQTMSSRLLRHFQNSTKHLRWSVLQKKFFFTKHSIFDISHGSEYTSGLLKFLCSGSQRVTWDCLIYAKLIIVFPPNLEFSPYLEVIQANKRLTKIKKKMMTNQFDVFDLSFIFFISMSQTISALNRTWTCYFLHASN